MSHDCPTCAGDFRTLVRNLRQMTRCARCGRKPNGTKRLSLKGGLCSWCRGKATRAQALASTIVDRRRSG